MPVIGLGTWELVKAGGERVEAIVRVSTPEEAVREALARVTPRT